MRNIKSEELFECKIVKNIKKKVEGCKYGVIYTIEVETGE